MQRGTARKQVRAHSHKTLDELDVVFGSEPPPELAAKEHFLFAVLEQMDFHDEASVILLRDDNWLLPQQHKLAATSQRAPLRRAGSLATNIGAYSVVMTVVMKF